MRGADIEGAGIDVEAQGIAHTDRGPLRTNGPCHVTEIMNGGI